MSLKDLKNKSPIFNWDEVTPFNVTDITTFETPVLDSMTQTNILNFQSELGDFREAPIPIYNPESQQSLEFSSTIKYGDNTYQGTKFDDSINIDGKEFNITQQFEDKIQGLKKFSDIYNPDQTVKDTKLTNQGGTDKLNLATAAHNSGFRKSIVGGDLGGNNDFGTEPYIITKVRNTNSGGAFDALNTQFAQARRDILRITKFIASEAGLSHIAKQNFLGLNARPNPFGDDGVTLTKETPSGFEAAIEKGGIVGTAAKLLPLGQKYKAIYNPAATILNTAAGVLGSQGSRLVRFDRDFPLFGSSAIFFGSTNDTYTEYLNDKDAAVYDDKLFYRGQASYKVQNKEENVTAASNVNQSMNPKTTNTGVSGFGDFMTLLDISETKESFTPLNGAFTKEQADELESTKAGMPFYFYDMRTNQYVVFRGYLEGLTENIAPEWSPEKYVGRSEPVYSYTGAERDISFTLKLYAHTTYELDKIYKKMNKLTSLCYPEYRLDSQLVNGETLLDVQSSEKFTRMKPPLVQMRLGELYGGDKDSAGLTGLDLAGFIKSLTYSVPDESPWEFSSGKRVPKYVTAAITYQVIHNEVPNLNTKFYGYIGS